MKRSIPPQGVKDDSGAYIKQKPSPPKSIDGLLAEGLTNIERMMDTLSQRTAAGRVEREDVQSLKDLISILHDLKEREQALLDSMSDEELEQHV